MLFQSRCLDVARGESIVAGQCCGTVGTGYATEAVIDLAIEDTTCGRCGKHVANAGYFKDASVTNTLKTAVHWVHY